MPKFSEDDYLDFCVLEALTVRGANDQKEAEKKKKMDEWKKGASELVPGASGKSRN